MPRVEANRGGEILGPRSWLPSRRAGSPWRRRLADSSDPLALRTLEWRPGAHSCPAAPVSQPPLHQGVQMPKLSPMKCEGKEAAPGWASGAVFPTMERRTPAPGHLWKESCSLPSTGTEEVINLLLTCWVVTGLEFHPIFCSHPSHKAATVAQS